MNKIYFCIKHQSIKVNNSWMSLLNGTLFVVIDVGTQMASSWLVWHLNLCQIKQIGNELIVSDQEMFPSANVCSNIVQVGSGGRAVERWTVNQEDSGSIPPTAVSKL